MYEEVTESDRRKERATSIRPAILHVVFYLYLCNVRANVSLTKREKVLVPNEEKGRSKK